MKLGSLFFSVVIGSFAFASPQKASGISDAKYALCAGQGTEMFIDFTQSKLSKDGFGMTVGTLGVVRVGHRKTPATGDFETIEIKYPVLIANGPSTTIKVSDSKTKLSASAKTYDFQTAKAELKLPPDTRTLDCDFYTAALP